MRAAVLLLAALVSGAGALAASATVDSGTSAGHVHALAFDTDGALLLGTHNGLYRLAPGESRPAKVGRVSYDLMGLAVVGRRSYVASGHPDPDSARRDGLPANLGLVRSDDGGRNWRSVSLLGAADFHVLRARGSRVLAYDVARGRLLASANGGRTWTARTPPPGTADVALGPARGLVAASTRDGVVVSTDSGAAYATRARGVGPGLVAWPAPRSLVLVDARGSVLVSADGGRAFRRRGSVRGEPAALAADGDRVAVLGTDGRLLLSRDGGRRFATIRWG